MSCSYTASGGGADGLARHRPHLPYPLLLISYQRFHFCVESFHSRLLYRWAALSAKGTPQTLITHVLHTAEGLAGHGARDPARDRPNYSLNSQKDRAGNLRSKCLSRSSIHYEVEEEGAEEDDE